MGDRHSLLVIGMGAVWLACLVFVVVRAVVMLQRGAATPWWANGVGLVSITGLYAWYRVRPPARSSVAAHGTALVATLALLVPVAYGMSSTIWWLSLVGFAMVLLGRRHEARVWGVAIPLLVIAAVLAEPHVQIPGAAGEPPAEASAAKIVFVLILVAMAAAFRRVAERRAAALHDSEERYRMLFQRAPVGVFHYDPGFRITHSNEQVEDLLGDLGRPLKGLDVRSLPDTRLLPAIRAALEGEPSTYDGPYRVTEDRPEVSISVRTVPLRASDGTIAGAIAMVLDVTEARRMEAELRRAHDELEHRVRERTEELRRHSRALRTLTECHHALLRADAEPSLLSEVCRIISESGQERSVSVRMAEPPGSGSVSGSGTDAETIEVGVAIPLRASDATLGVLGVLEAEPTAFDAEERKLLQELADDLAFGIVALRTRRAHELTERALRESEERYRLLFERNLAGVFRWTTDGRFIDCNEACARIFGYGSCEELMATPVPELFDEPEEHAQTLERLRAAGQLLSHEARYRCRSGRTVWVIENLSLAGDVIEGTLVDVTERRVLQEQLLQAQKMEAVGVLAGGVAHDFNNLLSVILSYTTFALESVPDGDELRADLLEIRHAGERAAALTRQLLAFSRRQILEPRPISLNEVLTGVEKMLRRILGEDITFVLRLCPDLGLTLADPGQVEQVLMNLVVNARDAMPTGGELTLATDNVELGEDFAVEGVDLQPGHYVRMTVTDTGCGMEAPFLARIFEPFFTTKAKGKGTGLGLATAYGVVKQSGGDIRVRSEVGRGSAFEVYLPLDDSLGAPRRPLSAGAQRPGGTETILVVEDEEGVRSLTARILRAAGYTVLSAAGGSEALRICETHPGAIHLLLTDVVMPQMGGRVLAESIRAVRPETRVLYMSGYTNDAILRHGTLEPGTHLIGKPFNAADLQRKVREAIDAELLPSGDGS